MAIDYYFFFLLRNNRLEHPTDAEILKLKPSFNHLTSINLSRCNLCSWANVLHVARMWPHIEQLALDSNGIDAIEQCDRDSVFTMLRELSLQANSLASFKDISRLGNIHTLQILDLQCNGIQHVELPACLPTECLADVFANVEQINLSDNPIVDHNRAFNELDKLPALKCLLVSNDATTGFDELFSSGVARITRLQKLNKMEIKAAQRRGAEYDLWKACGSEWIRAQLDETERLTFDYSCRAYARIIQSKYLVLLIIIEIRVCGTVKGFENWL